MIVVFSIKIAVDCENKMWLVYGYSNKMQCLTLHLWFIFQLLERKKKEE